MATTEQTPVRPMAASPTGLRISGFILTVQAILLAVHWMLYETWAFFVPPETPGELALLRLASMLLALSFVGASLLAWRYWNVWVRAFYRLAAVWLGFVNFFFLAACLCWPVLLALRLAGSLVPRGDVAFALFGLAGLAGLAALINAHFPRVKRVAVKLPNLPQAWRGRTAAVISDVHLGHVNGSRFMRRILHKLEGLRPDVVFVPGDLFDGTAADLDEVVAPWKEFTVPLGVYFVTGNHEEFSERGKYLRAVERVGMRVLNNEKVLVDGLQVVGVHDRESVEDAHLRIILEAARLDRDHASVLLLHVPRGLRTSEAAGISLQLSGHTHGGQIFPFTWFTWRIFRQVTHGLARIGQMAVYTSFGAGTWGPPMRLGTWPEIVLLEFI